MKTLAGKTSLFAIATLLLNAPAQAEREIPANWHQVEVIVFAQNDMHGAEKSPPDPQLTYPAKIRILSEADQLHPTLAPDASEDERLAALMVPERFLRHETATALAGYVPLAPEQRQLTADAQTLNRNSGFRVLFHQAWQQPIDSGSRSEWIYIHGGNTDGEHSELEGSLRLSLSRYYHLETNLWLSRFGRAAPAHLQPDATQPLDEIPAIPHGPALPPPPATQKSPQLRQIEAISARFANDDSPILNEAAQPRSTEVMQVDILKSSEQVRSKRLHYVDHPRMGVLLLVTPLADDGKEEAEEDFE